MQTPLIPRSDTSSASLFFVVVALCFLNACASLGVRFLWSATSNWTSRATGELTIRVKGDTKNAKRAAEIIRGAHGVDKAQLLSRKDSEKLLSPWLGKTTLPETLPLPGLVAVQLQPGLVSGSGDTIIKRIQSSLKQANIKFELNNHADFVREVKRIVSTVRTVLASVLLLLWMTALAVISFATRAALSARRDIVEVLHLAGARDSFIASLFERRFFLMGLQAGVIGVILAFIITALIGRSLENSEEYAWLIPQISLSLKDSLVLIVIPGIAGIASMAAARATAMRTLATP